MCGPNLLDTGTSLAIQNVALHDLYNLKASQIVSALNADCTAFDKNNACLTASGTYTRVGHDQSSEAMGTLIGGYRVNSNLRIGGLIAQGAGTGGQNIELSDIPMIGVYGDWQQNADGTGFAAHVSAGFQESDVNIQRQVVSQTFAVPFPPFVITVPGSEAGAGDAELYTRGSAAILSYGVRLDEGLLTPYAGLMETDITRGGYAETARPGVTDPLTFKSLTDRQTTGVAGLHLDRKVAPHTVLKLTGGFEHDFGHDIGKNIATSALGTSTATFGATYRRTRGVASAAAAFEVAPLRTVTVGIGLRQEALGATTSMTAGVAYQIGF